MKREITIWLFIAGLFGAFKAFAIPEGVTTALSGMLPDLVVIGTLRFMAEVGIKAFKLMRLGIGDGKYF